MSYIENPKTKASGVICAIPQTGICPNKCEDCFFQSGRSFLEPLDKNLPNMPPMSLAKDAVVRVNDGNDSNVNRKLVLEMTKNYPNKFYNTAIPTDLEGFKINDRVWPVVLTANPAAKTDKDFYKLNPIPENLMFVRFRINSWNLTLADKVVDHYTKAKIPVVFTFMAYYTESIPKGHEDNYTYRKRTLNSYWVITPKAWDLIMERYKDNEYVYTCGKDANTFPCHRCGNCLREYFATTERIKRHG